MKRDVMRFEGPGEWQEGRHGFQSVCSSVVARL